MLFAKAAQPQTNPCSPVPSGAAYTVLLDLSSSRIKRTIDPGKNLPRQVSRTASAW